MNPKALLPRPRAATSVAGLQFAGIGGAWGKLLTRRRGGGEKKLTIATLRALRPGDCAKRRDICRVHGASVFKWMALRAESKFRGSAPPREKKIRLFRHQFCMWGRWACK